MCVLCGTTQVPVCAVTGQCGINFQQVASLAVIVSGSTLAIGRVWIIEKFQKTRVFIENIFRNEKN